MADIDTRVTEDSGERTAEVVTKARTQGRTAIWAGGVLMLVCLPALVWAWIASPPKSWNSGDEICWYVISGLSVVDREKVVITEDLYEPMTEQPTPAEIVRMALEVDSKFFTGAAFGRKTPLSALLESRGDQLRGKLYNMGYKELAVNLSSFAGQ
jgi:hypothetical protein